MAVGKTQMPIIEDKLEHVVQRYKELEDQYNTFQYVVKNIENWANETDIGMELRQDMMVLVNCFQAMIQNTKDLETKIRTFIANQKLINKN